MSGHRFKTFCFIILAKNIYIVGEKHDLSLPPSAPVLKYVIFAHISKHQTAYKGNTCLKMSKVMLSVMVK